MQGFIAGLDPVVILLVCPIMTIAVCGYILLRFTIGRKR